MSRAVEPGELGQRVEPELAAEDGRRARAARGSAGERRPRRWPMTARTLGGIRSAAPVSPRRPSASSSRTTSADEERVALGLGVDRRDELVRRPGRGGELDVLGDVVLGQAVERDLARVRLAHELGERCRQRVAEGRIDVAVGADDQQAAAGDLARDEAQQQERRLVGGVDVVEDDDERLGSAACRRKAPTASKRRKRAPSGRGRAAAARAGSRSSGSCARSRRARARRASTVRARVAAQRLHPRPVRRGAARLPAAPDQDLRLARPRPGGELLGEPALADPGLAADQQDAPAAAERVARDASSRAASSRARPTKTPRAMPARAPRRARRRRAPRPGRGSPGAGRAARAPARSRAPRPASRAPPGRRRAHPPGVRSDRGRA